MANLMEVFANAGRMGPPHAFFPFGLLGLVAWLLVLAGAAVLIFWAVRAMPMYRPAAAVPSAVVESPLDILARRFASGEITAEEYEKGRQVLRAGPPMPPKPPKS
jgi:uncharacterized membrane protein